MATVGAPDVPQNTKVVGATLPDEVTDFKPRLAGFGPDKTVAIYNPLPDDFQFLMARSVTEAPTITDQERRVKELAGLPMNKEGSTVNHYTQAFILKAGETKNYPGDLAQKCVQDLVTYILGIEGTNKGKLIADGNARKRVEDQIIVTVYDNIELMNSLKPQDREVQVEKLNKPTEAPVEPPDPPPGEGVSFESTGQSAGGQAKAAKAA